MWEEWGRGFMGTSYFFDVICDLCINTIKNDAIGGGEWGVKELLIFFQCNILEKNLLIPYKCVLFS